MSRAQSISYFKAKVAKFEQELQENKYKLVNHDAKIAKNIEGEYFILSIPPYAIRISVTSGFPDYPPNIIFVDPKTFQQSSSSWPNGDHIQSSATPPWICTGFTMDYWDIHHVTPDIAKLDDQKYWIRNWRFYHVLSILVKLIKWY